MAWLVTGDLAEPFGESVDASKDLFGDSCYVFFFDASFLGVPTFFGIYKDWLHDDIAWRYVIDHPGNDETLEHELQRLVDVMQLNLVLVIPGFGPERLVVGNHRDSSVETRDGVVVGETVDASGN